MDFASLLKRDEDEETEEIEDTTQSTHRSHTKRIEELLEQDDDLKVLSKSLDYKVSDSYLEEVEPHEPLLSKSVAKEHKYMQSSLSNLDKFTYRRQVSRTSRVSTGSKSVGDLPATVGSLLSLGSIDPDIKV